MLDEGEDRTVGKWRRTPVMRVLMAWRIELGEMMDPMWAGGRQQNDERQCAAAGMESGGDASVPAHPGTQGGCAVLA